jgi:hypothetical protein
MKFFSNPFFKASLIRNSFVQFVWWLIFFPGFFSADSFAAVQMAKSGELENSFTASWALYVRIFSFHGNAIALLTLINGLVLVYSVTRFGYAIFSTRTAATSTFLLTLTPVVSGMGITLWHDILMSAGILLITSFFINIMRDSSKVKKLMLLELLPGGILASFRPNGLPTILVFALFYSIYIFLRYRSQIRQSMKLLSKVILVTTLVTIFSSNIILGLSPINSSFAKQWMQFDISCYASTADGKGFVERNIPNIGTTETWKSVDACVLISKTQISVEEATQAERFITPAWIQILRVDPTFIVNTHLKRHAYLNPLPIFGIPKAPFLHSNIEFKNQGIDWKFPEIANVARNLMRIWNGARGLMGWAGFWLLLTIAFTKLGNSERLVPPILMGISLMSILFVVAPIPDGRYTLFVLIAGQLILLGRILDFLIRFRRVKSEQQA